MTLKGLIEAYRRHQMSEESAVDYELMQLKTSFRGKWIQRGPYITNKSSEVEHGTYIGNNKRLVGVTEDGEPILEELK